MKELKRESEHPWTAWYHNFSESLRTVDELEIAQVLVQEKMSYVRTAISQVTGEKRQGHD